MRVSQKSAWTRPRRVTGATIAGALLAAFLAPEAAAQAGCNATAGATTYLPLPASPFAAVATPDGCTIFVSLTGDFPGVPNGIAIVQRGSGKLTVQRVIVDMDTPYGLAITHDGKVLIVANNDNLVFLDPARMARSEDHTVLGYFSAHAHDNPIGIYANVTADDGYLFVAEENAGRIGVIDLAAARLADFKDTKMLGAIPAGFAPIALTFSPDGKYLYVTVQQAEDSDHWPAACKPEGEDPAVAMAENPEGAVVVVDVARAKTDPEHAAVAKTPAGCSPVRLAVSPDGARAYVTARADNAMVVFDTAKLLADPAHARIATVPVGVSPVGIALIDDGKKIVVANSNRFAHEPQTHESLSVIDAATLSVLGAIETGTFPRELSLTADGGTLLVTNSGSDSLELIDLTQLPLAKGR